MRILALFLLLPLVGCAGTLSKMYYPLIKERDPAWTATVTSEKSRIYIEWTSAIPGEEKQVRSIPEFAAIPVISAGVTQQWRWTVRAEKAASESVQKVFSSLDGQGTGVTSSVGTLVPLADWPSAMSRLYRLSEFLLSKEPPTANIDVILVPENQSYRHSIKVPLTDPVTIEIIIPFPVRLENENEVISEGLSALTRTVAIIGMHLQHVALAYGVTSAPESGTERIVKAHSNSLCWLTAARRALYLGTDLPVRPSSDGISLRQLKLAIPLIRTTYEDHPDDQSVLQTLAGITLLRDEERFLESRRTQRPSVGTQADRIDSLMGFCRDYLQYSGNILEDPIPLEGIPSASLLNESENQ